MKRIIVQRTQKDGFLVILELPGEDYIMLYDGDSTNVDSVVQDCMNTIGHLAYREFIWFRRHSDDIKGMCQKLLDTGDFEAELEVP